MNTQNFDDSNNNNLKTPNLEKMNNPFEINDDSIECLTTSPNIFTNITQVIFDYTSYLYDSDEDSAWKETDIKRTEIQINQSSMVLQGLNDNPTNEKIQTKINKFWSKFKLESPLVIKKNESQEKVNNN
ncbi:unnamed protein product [Brachionus calyciflorus]|uniref:Uncharacterized protein n=1 Tax=Brachionus calyciflorus TaxID=104777 RepID=A0A814EKF9_9BILA|nr:unnamed protein product [Brachionus calyciflorus]